jgi:hypothetical protein
MLRSEFYSVRRQSKALALMDRADAPTYDPHPSSTGHRVLL